MKTIHYVLSEQCNMNCNYCGVDVKNKAKHSNNDFIQFYNDYLKDEKEEYRFDIFGGEPFLNPKEVKFIVNYLEAENLCVSINITSNATLWNPIIKEIIQHPKTKITVSHDGLFMDQNRNKTIKQTRSMYFEDYSYACKSVNKTLNVHSMITGSMFDTPYPSLLIFQYGFIKDSVLGDPVIDFEIVRDLNSWNMTQAKNFIEAYNEYVDFLCNMISEPDFFLNNTKIDQLYMSFASALIESSSNKDYQRPTCGVNTGKYKTFFQNKYIACERFERYAPAQEYLYISSKFDKLYNKCNSCSIKKLCNRGCVYETILNKQPINEVCYILKESFKIVQKSFDKVGPNVLRYFYKGNK